MENTNRRALKREGAGVDAIVALAMVLVAHLPAPLSAQDAATDPPDPSPSESQATDIPDLSGTWERIRLPRPERLPPDARGFGRMGELSLNARGRAMRDAFDEPLHPMYDCVPTSIPQIFGDPYNFSIEQLPDRVIIRFEKDEVIRTVWLEGHGHREATGNDYSIQGYSTGRYEGGDLVVETTRFAFSPAGLNERSPMVPASTSKRTVERFSREGADLVVEVVVEDPRFLEDPILFSYLFGPTEDPLVDWLPCDPEQARAPLRLMPEEDLKYGIR